MEVIGPGRARGGSARCCRGAGACGRPATSLTAVDYLAFADRLQVALEPTWDAKAGAYRTRGTLFVRVNAAMLLALANAALAGHAGASRQDARARSMVRLLTQAPALPVPVEQRPGWTSRIDSPNTPGHFSLDPKVAEALAAAYQARARMACPRDRSAASATGSRSLRVAAANRKGHLDQVNWNADLYLADSIVNGRSLVRSPTARAQVVSRPRPEAQPPAARRTSTRLRLPLPPGPARARENRNSTGEYASMVLGVVLPYDLARNQGMRSISSREGRSRGAGSSASCTATGRTRAC